MNLRTANSHTTPRRSTKRRFPDWATCLLCLLVGAGQASAHTIVIGYTPGVSAGQVNLWLGSYHGDGIGDGPSIEGSARLQGAGGYDTTTAFTFGVGIASSDFGPTPFAPVPAGLVFGTNLFASQDFANTYTGGVASTVPSWVNSWEAVTISGLSAGTYTFTYVPIASPTAHWAPWADLQSINLTLTSGDTGGGGTTPGVPEGGMTFTLLGIAFAALAGLRRKWSA